MTFKFYKIKSVKPLVDFKLKIRFVEDVTKVYDVKPWFEKFPVFLELKIILN